jgi:hypothetical protein
VLLLFDVQRSTLWQLLTTIPSFLLLLKFLLVTWITNGSLCIQLANLPLWQNFFAAGGIQEPSKQLQEK